MIFSIFCKILRFFIFLVAMSTVFLRSTRFFAVDFRFLCERWDLKDFLIVFCTNMGFVGCDCEGYSNQFCLKWAFLTCFFVLLVGICVILEHFIAFLPAFIAGCVKNRWNFGFCLGGWWLVIVIIFAPLMFVRCVVLLIFGQKK